MVSTISYHCAGQAYSGWEDMYTGSRGALENILEAGYDGIKGEWNFPTGHGRRNAFQAEEINNRTNK